MPWINGNFYANRAYGQHIEDGLAEDATQANTADNLADEGSDWANESQPDPDPAQGPARQQPAPRQQRQQPAHPQLGVNDLANVIHNEAGGARPTADHGPGSADDLAQARMAMAQVIVNRQAANMRHAWAPATLAPREQVAVTRNPIARAQYQDARNAAERATHSGGNPQGAVFFFHAREGMPLGDRPVWARGTPIERHGPFVSQGGGAIPRGARFYVETFAAARPNP